MLLPGLLLRRLQHPPNPPHTCPHLCLQEFPDVFAFPRLVTTRHPEEMRRYRADLPDMEEEPAAPAAPPAAPAADSQQAGTAEAATDGAAAGSTAADKAGAGSGKDSADSLWPEPLYMPPEQFQAAVAQGAFVQHGPELFVHQQVAAQWAVTPEALREVIASGRLPLLEMEVEGVEMVNASKVGGCWVLGLALTWYSPGSCLWIERSTTLPCLCCGCTCLVSKSRVMPGSRE
jgi:hypothetical protein